MILSDQSKDWAECTHANMNACLLFLPVKPGVSAASFLAKASTSMLESNFRGLKCTLKMDALPLISGGPVEKRKQTYHEFYVKVQHWKSSNVLPRSSSYSSISSHTGALILKTASQKYEYSGCYIWKFIVTAESDTKVVESVWRTY